MPKQDSKPTSAQLRYLRQLADHTGTTFTPPATRRQASAEIARLKRRPASARFERRDDRRAVGGALGEQQPASSVRDDEIQGYGGNATWK
jgi:hypothetical protein